MGAFLRATNAQRALLDLGGRQPSAVLELFADNAGTLGAGRSASPREGLHQASGDVLNLLRSLREYPGDLVRRLRHTAIARTEFVVAQRVLLGRPVIDFECDPQRAWAFVVDNLAKDSRGHYSQRGARRIPAAADALPELVDVLRRVELFHDYLQAINAFDQEGGVILVPHPEVALGDGPELDELGDRLRGLTQAAAVVLTTGQLFDEGGVSRRLSNGRFLWATDGMQEQIDL